MTKPGNSDSFDEFKRLARLASRETVPPADVTAKVLRRITTARESIDRPLAYMAMAAAVTAAVLALLVYPQLQSLFDPLTSLVAEAAESTL